MLLTLMEHELVMSLKKLVMPVIHQQVIFVQIVLLNCILNKVQFWSWKTMKSGLLKVFRVFRGTNIG